MRHRLVTLVALLALAAGATAAVCGGAGESGDVPTPAATATVARPRPTDTPVPPRTPVAASWEDAVARILACDVTSAGQTHARNVYLTLRDGSELTTVEPHLDELFAVVRAADAAGCDSVSLWTE